MATLSEGVEGLVFSSSEFSLLCFLLSWLFWVYVHQKLSLRLPAYFLPSSAWKTHCSKIRQYEQQKALECASKKQQEGPSQAAAGAAQQHCAASAADPARSPTGGVPCSPKELRVYYVTARANATAVLHAALICPAAVAVIAVTISAAWAELEKAPSANSDALRSIKWFIWDWGETNAFYNFRSFLLDIIAYVMAGYFSWDLMECVKNRDVHSKAFLLHAVLSLYAMLAYLFTQQGKMTGISAFICLSEVSTPAIHMRWFLVQTKETATKLFKLTDVFAAGLFISFRLVLLPLGVLSHLLLEWLSGCTYTSKAPFWRRASFALSCCLWVALNAYWALLFVRTLLRHREKKAADKRRE